MIESRYIGIEEWMREWHSTFVGINGEIGSHTTAEPVSIIFPGPPDVPIFLGENWELAVLPGDCMDDLTETAEHLQDEDRDPSFTGRDEMEVVFKTLEKLQISDMVVTELGFTSLDTIRDIRDDRAAMLCAASRQGYEQNPEVSVFPAYFYLFDRSGRWCMSGSSEQITVLGGDPEFMQTFYEVSGGKQAVMDRLAAYLRSEDWWLYDDRESFVARLFPRLGWDYTPK